MLSVNTNTLSLNIQRMLINTSKDINQAAQRLASGKRINSAKDDAAGLAIAERMTSQIRGMNTAIRNTNDAMSLATTAEGATKSMSEALQRMRELAVQSASDSNTIDRGKLDAEFQALTAEIDRIATTTDFNGKKIIGADAGALVFQVGANAGDTLTMTTTNLTTVNDAITDITTQANASAAMTAIDTAIDTISTQRASYGAYQSRFGFTIDNLSNAVSAMEEARSRIMDADIGAESTLLQRAEILQQAGIAMLAKANQQKGSILNLFA